MLALTLLAAVLPLVEATTLTYKLTSHERACFYATSKQADEKVAFYFAVLPSNQVQSGGNYDIDYDILDPKNVLVQKGTVERQGDYVFTAQHIGEYSFCFSNTLSSFADKLIDFDITMEHESRFSSGFVISELEKSVGPISGKDKKSPLEKATLDIEGRLGFVANEILGIEHSQRNIRTRENRNLDMAKALQSRMFWVAVIGATVMVMMAIAQVFVIQSFFQKGRGRL